MSTPPQDETALVVLVPEVDESVVEFRSKYDSAVAAGLPAHITILYPFKNPSDIAKDVIDQLAVLFAEHSRFVFSLGSAKKFSNAVYLEPFPDGQFKELTEAVVERFPETLPYGGAFPDIIPHLTIGRAEDSAEVSKMGTEYLLSSVGRAPIEAEADRVWLLVRRGDRWQPMVSFALSGA